MSDVDDRAHLARLAELGTMTATLLHEIRQPVFALQALAELQLADGGAGPWRTVLDQVREIERLVAHYGTLARREGPPGLVDVVVPARAAVEMVARRAELADVSVATAWPPRSAWVLGHEGPLRQVILNLLQNALDAVGTQDDRRVGVEVRAEDGEVRVLVRDSGPGVDDAVRDRLFDPFVTSKAAGQGTGLGLHVSRQIVTEAGGELTLDSDRDGTIATVTLPAAALG